MKVEIIVKEGFEIFTRSRNNKESARAHQSAVRLTPIMYNQTGVVWFDGDG